MRAAPLVSGMFLVALVSPVLAQTPECSTYVANAQRVCAAAVDGTRALHPLIGVLVSGGNPMIGSAGTLGGLGHVMLTLRANAVEVVLPDLSYNGSASSVPAGDKLWAPAPLVEGALGVYRGVGNGLLAVDLLGSAQLLPTDQIDNLTVDANARSIGGVALGLGYGARVGLLAGRGPLPAVSVSIMRRDIPEITYGNVPAGDRFSYGVDLHATNLRLVASKQLLFLDMAAGLGWDKYTGDAVIQFRDPITNVAQPEIPVELNSSRVLGFLNAGMNLSVVRLTAEVGYQGGKDQNLSSDFEDFDTTKGKLFAGLGLRVGF
ncbi:MAG: hypothetical protein QOH59_2480 [Gemmatimonadales bacterium]|jgi:hypothetical protein|nr:hypothetical protein [Gemmatimonadales bacterium]